MITQAIHYVNRVLPRIRIAGIDYGPWLDLGWLMVCGYGIQWKHERYLTPHPLKPIFRFCFFRIVFSVIKHETAYRRLS